MIEEKKIVHAFGDDVLGNYDAVGLATLIREQKVSIQEVMDATIARAEKVNPQLNAIELECFQQARNSLPKNTQGIFTGVPTFIKDNTDLKGLPTRYGSNALKTCVRQAKKDGAFAQQYLEQGFIVLGKTKLPEFGFNASTELMKGEPTRNPWHTDYSAGGSSGGSAALVAAGVVPIAHANDGGGSIRIPAACCGLVGLKPSRGRMIDSERVQSLPINIVTEGVITRSVRDTAHFMAGMEHSFKNVELPPVGLVEYPGKKRLRVGLFLDSLTTTTDLETQEAVMSTAKILEGLGHNVEYLPIPVSQKFVQDFRLYWGMLSFMTATFGKKAISPDFDVKNIDNLSRGLKKFYQCNFYKTPVMLHRLKRTCLEYSKVFQNYDILLSPVLAHTTPKLGYLSPEQDFEQLFDRLQKYVAFTPWNNASGGPAISLPMGVTSNGLPIGVHLAANHGEERLLLELAFELEQAAPWRHIGDVAKHSQ